MRGRINAHRFINAAGMIGMILRNLPPRLCLHQRQQIGPITVNLIGAGENEHRLGRMQPHRLQQMQRAHRIHPEVRQRLARRPVVGRLRRRMNHRRQIAADPLHNPLHRRHVPDVHSLMPITFQAQKGRLRLRRGSLRTKKIGAHPVVDAHNVEAFCKESLYGFRAHQTGGPRDKNSTHILGLESRP